MFTNLTTTENKQTNLNPYLHHGHNTIFIWSKNLHHIFTSWTEIAFNATNFHSFHKHPSQAEWNLHYEL